MLERPAVIYMYDGTFDGFLTAVFEAYARKCPVGGVFAEGGVQQVLGQEVVQVATDEAKARRVEAGIHSKIGGLAYHNVWQAFWSGDADKDTALYRYIRAGFRLGRAVYGALADDDVRAVEYLCRNVGREVEHLKGFVRFSQLEGDVYYSRIEPKNSIVPLLMPHFADRFNDMPFLLHDAGHALTGIYDMKGWYLVEGEEINVPDFTEQEKQYRRLWRTFYDTIAVQDRVSHRRRRTMMPMFYWKNLSELHPRWARKEEDAGEKTNVEQLPQKWYTG